MKTLTTKMLELAATPGFEMLTPAEQDRFFEKLLSTGNE
jgi:hypothetical protein